MPDYQKGQIYSIRSYQTDDIYIGSTCDNLRKRFSSHKSQYKANLKDKNNNISCFKILKYDDAYIELIEDYPCDNKQQLLKQEGVCIRATENCINRCVAGRTPKQYKEDNKEILKEKRKKYREDNADKIKEQRKVQYALNSERQAQYRKDKKEHYEQWRIDNVEVLKEKKRQYYIKNKEILKEKMKVSYEKNKERDRERSKRHYEKNKVLINQKRIDAKKT